MRGLLAVARRVFASSSVTETEVSGIEPDAVERLLEGSIGALIPLCTEPLPVRHAESGARSTLLHFSGIDRLDAWGAMNRHFLREEWSDGFPLVAPTPEAVEKMLSGTRRKRDEVVVFFEPHKGTATVEKIAINAVMAGCEPAHLPVLLTAIECIHEPAYNVVIALTSTGHIPHFLLIVNGPIVKELGINSGLATLGAFGRTVLGQHGDRPWRAAIVYLERWALLSGARGCGYHRISYEI